jgi:two-component system chemotaxis response regulator CheY
VQVMIIDDDVVSRMVLMHLVDSAGAFEVLEAEDGEDAWRQLQAGARPAIVFCDLRMPRLSGMALLARVKADAGYAGLPFVLVSAAGDAATMEQALGLGADGYIVKPFDGAKVGDHLARLVVAGAAADKGAVSRVDQVGDESPDVTMRRLGIDATRLRLYLGGLERQLAGAAQEIAQLDAAGAAAALERLKEGCTMLGLHGAAAGLAGLRGGRSGPEEQPRTLDTVLDATLAAVRRRQDMLGGMPA